MTFDSDASNKIKENKYKILRMSLLLGQDADREETISNFEEAAREIDKMNDEIYLAEVEKKFIDTLTLEEEEAKLADLVDYIGGRIGQRESLLHDFSNITGYDLTSLPMIKYSDKLLDYKDRLNYIREYLSNTAEINSLNSDLEELESKLAVSHSNKEKAESINEKNEDSLLEKFKNIIKGVDEYNKINIDEIDDTLVEIGKDVDESKKSLDIFNKSFNTLELSGISKEEEQEFYSYVESAKENYYKYKETEYILTLYKLLLSKEKEYAKLLDKRSRISSLLEDRLMLRKSLSIKDKDLLFDLYELFDRQFKSIEDEKNDLDEIDYLSGEIKNKNDRIKELELDNQKVEILSLLKEFCIIDTYDDVGDSTDIDTELDNYYENGDGEGSSDAEKVSSNEVDNSGNNNSENEEESLDVGDNIELSSPVDSDENIFGDTDEIGDNLFDAGGSEAVNDNSSFAKEDTIGADQVQDISGDTNGSDVDFSTNFSNEDVKDNQVVNVRDAVGIDLGDVIEKANSVMKRVGNMLGIKNEERSSSKENDIFADRSGVGEISDDGTTSSVATNSDANVIPVNNQEVKELPVGVVESNTDVGNGTSDNAFGVESGVTSNDSNPFIGSSVDALGNEFKLEGNPFENTTFDNNSFGNDNFWDNVSDGGVLDTLPDLPSGGEVSGDNFFANNDFSDLNIGSADNTEV